MKDIARLIALPTNKRDQHSQRNPFIIAYRASTPIISMCFVILYHH